MPFSQDEITPGTSYGDIKEPLFLLVFLVSLSSFTNLHQSVWHSLTLDAVGSSGNDSKSLIEESSASLLGAGFRTYIGQKDSIEFKSFGLVNCHEVNNVILFPDDLRFRHSTAFLATMI